MMRKFRISQLFTFVITFTLGLIIFQTLAYKNYPIRAVSVNLESASPSPETRTRKPLIWPLKSLSPIDIQNFVNKNNQVSLVEIWRGLGIEKQYKGFYSEYNPSFLQICRGCSAEIYQCNLDETEGKEILLRISDAMAGSTRYLIFAQSEKEKWNLLGFIDHSFPRYSETEHSFLLHKEKAYLLIHAWGATGTGISLIVNGLFTISNNNILHLATYPAQGYLSSTSAEPSIKFNGQINTIELTQEKVKIEINIFSVYSGVIHHPKVKNHFLKLFDSNQKYIFQRNLNNSQKILQTTSEIFDKQMESVWKMTGSIDEPEFLQQNFNELKKIARQKGTRKNLWLKEYLSRSSNSKKKRQLIKIIK